MRKGRSISITLGYVVRVKPRCSRNYFDFGCSIWNGNRFDCLTSLEFTAAEEKELIAEGCTQRTVKITFPPPALQVGAVASFGREKAKRALIDRLEKKEKYRAQMRFIDGVGQDLRLVALSRSTGFYVGHLEEMERVFGTLELRGDELGHAHTDGYFEVVAEREISERQ